jgi:hypothetical protein
MLKKSPILNGGCRWTTWRCDAVLEIGCPAPLSPHHVTITVSIADRSMNPTRQAMPSTSLDSSPQMTEAIHLVTLNIAVSQHKMH